MVGDELMKNGGEGEAAALDAIVVGAGFAGLYLLHRLRGMGFKVLVLEAWVKSGQRLIAFFSARLTGRKGARSVTVAELIDKACACGYRN